ncbi:hypothetical protein JYU12_00595 [bacterium AH-315-K03]|nr:hypothetical protein [bacterium AH-315-K03]
MEFLLFVFIIALLACSILINIVVRSLKNNSPNTSEDTKIVKVLRNKKFVLFSTVGGTFTSLASVYLFFLLQSSRYGWVAFFSLLGLPLGAYVAQKLCNLALIRAEKDEAFKTAIKNGVMSSMHAICSLPGTAEICRKVSIANIFAVIWLETKVLSTITIATLAPHASDDSLYIAMVSAGVIFFLVQYIVKFGMNGVILTDALYWPLIILSVLVVTASTFINYNNTDIELTASMLFQTQLPTYMLVGFVFNAILINAIYQVAREDQWLRVSAFRSDENIRLNPAVTSIFSTSLMAVPVWLFLIISGLVFGYLVGDGVLSLNSIIEISKNIPFFVPVLLLGMFASMMSTVDNQLFTAKRLLSLDIKKNKISDLSSHKIDSIIYSIGLSSFFFILTYAVIESDLNDIELVFTCLGLPAVLFPSIFRVLLGGCSRPSDIYVPLFIYVLCSLFAYWVDFHNGFIQVIIPPATLIIGVLYSSINFNQSTDLLKEVA